MTPLQEKLREKIGNKYNNARTVWAALMLIGIGLVAYFLPLWYLIVMIPVGIITYMLTLALVSLVISGELTEEEMEEVVHGGEEVDKAFEGKKSAEEVAKENNVDIHDIMVVDDMGPIIGTYLDKPIYEYVDVKRPGEKVVQRFPYFGPADVKKGIPVIPSFEDMVFAVVEGVLYAITIPTQPAK